MSIFDIFRQNKNTTEKLQKRDGSQHKTIANQSITEVEPVKAEAEKVPASDSVIGILKRLNCEYKTEEREHSLYILFDYQGGHFRIDASKHNETICIEFPFIYDVEAEQMNLVRTHCNEMNFRARFSKFLHGQPVELAPDEVPYFNEMKSAYETYQEIVTTQQASVIDDLDKLARLIRCELQDKPDTAKGIVNNWYNDHADQYVRQVLESKMGSHLDQSRVFNLLTSDRKVHFFRLVSDKCLAQGLSGLKAGSFMLGRFVSKPISTSVWNRLSNRVVAFLLNEYVLYEKYIHVLEEVGEIRLARAHSRIETEGIDNMVIEKFDMLNFVPLIFSVHDWTQVAKELECMEHQDNTHLLVDKLSKPIDQIFDMNNTYTVNQVNSHRMP